MEKRLRLFFLLRCFAMVGISLFMISCGGGASGGGNDDPEDSPGNFTLVSDLFNETVNGLVTTTTFTINDEKYWSINGYTLWTVWGDESPSDAFAERTVTLHKSDGDKDAGYGFVICQGLRDGYGNTMLTIMINVDGYYTIGKVVDAKYEPLFKWTKSGYIHQGFGVDNTIRVAYDSGSRLFSLYINGFFIQTFKDEDVPVHTGGKNGYLVVISPQDTFPAEYVDVEFKETK
jgi:hypothetical protein